MLQIAESIIPDLAVISESAGSVKPGGANETKLRVGAMDNILLAAQYTPAQDEHVKEIRLLLKKNGTITSGKVLSVSIQGDSSGAPDGTAIGTSLNVGTDDVPTSAAWITFTFANHVQLVKNTVYHIVLNGDYDVSAVNNVSWISATVASGGNQEIKDASWSNVVTENFNVSMRVWNLGALGMAEPILYAAIEYPGIFTSDPNPIELGEIAVQSQGPMLEIRSADVAAPANGTAVKVRGVSYTVLGVDTDAEGFHQLTLTKD